MSDPTNTNNAAPGGNGSSETQTHAPLPVPVEVENAWRECEARLQILRSDIEKLRTNAAEGGKSTSFPDDPKIQQLLDILNSLAKDPFSLIERDMAHAKEEGHAKQKLNARPHAAETPSNKVSPGPNAPTQNPSPANPTNAAPSTTRPNITSDDGIPPTGTNVLTPVQSNVAPVSYSTPQNASSPDFNFLPFTTADTEGSQETQASGERFLAALEQNTQMTTSLFNEMLALMDGQNRVLGEMNRKISDLNGQLNSLKNP